MIIDKPSVLLFIEPAQPRSQEPLLDELTYKILYLRRTHIAKGTIMANGEFVENIYTMGVHHCTGCKNTQIHSHSYDIMISGGYTTNTLAAHYLAYHREEVPTSEIEKLSSINIKVLADDVMDIKQEELGIFPIEPQMENSKKLTL